jgi:hypothetical protein
MPTPQAKTKIHNHINKQLKTLLKHIFVRTRVVNVGAGALAELPERKYTSNASPPPIAISARVPVNVTLGSNRNP